VVHASALQLLLLLLPSDGGRTGANVASGRGCWVAMTAPGYVVLVGNLGKGTSCLNRISLRRRRDARLVQEAWHDLRPGLRRGRLEVAESNC